MLKRVAWLWIAVLLGLPGLAQAHPHHFPPRDKAPQDYPTNVVKILRTTNKAQTNSYFPFVFEMKNNNPYNVIRYLRRPIELEEGVLFTFVNESNDGGLVLCVVPRYMEESLRAQIASLDVAGMTTSSGTERHYQQLKHRRADGKAEDFSDSSDAPFLETAAGFSTGNGSLLLADPEVNALYWEDAPSGAQALKSALDDWLDHPTASAQFDVKIYELEAVNDAKIGLDYISWKNTQGQNLLALGGFSEYGSLREAAGNVPSTLPFDPLGTGARGLPRSNFDASGYNYAYQYVVSSEFFDFLAVKGKARVMNKMKVSALNRRPARVSAGDQVLFYRTVTSSSDSRRDFGNPYSENDARDMVGTTNRTTLGSSSTLEPVEVGLCLKLLPTISEESIQLKVKVNWSDYFGFDSNGAPKVNSREFLTDFRLGVNDEVVFGGLNRQVQVKSTQKTPILGLIPIIGYFFGGETQQNQTNELVVALKPTAIMDYDVAMDYKMTEDDKKVIQEANDTVNPTLPATHFGFDQYLLDVDRGVDVPAIK